MLAESLLISRINTFMLAKNQSYRKKMDGDKLISISMILIHCFPSSKDLIILLTKDIIQTNTVTHCQMSKVSKL